MQAAIKYTEKNALTAGMLCINNMNAIRQQNRPCDVVNSIVTDGGLAANTIPDNCELQFSVRSDTSEHLKRVLTNLEHSVQAAALVTGCEYEMEAVKNPMRDTKSNHELAWCWQSILTALERLMCRRIPETSLGMWAKSLMCAQPWAHTSRWVRKKSSAIPQASGSGRLPAGL